MPRKPWKPTQLQPKAIMKKRILLSREGRWLANAFLEDDGTLTYLDTSYSLIGARGAVESAGQLAQRVTATRAILTGPFALIFRKNYDSRELYMTVTLASGEELLIPVNPKDGAKARLFISKLNETARTKTSA